jgi:hypothetical protein
VVTGTHGKYRWLTGVDYTLSGLIQICPSIVEGQHAALTTFDSGPLRLTAQDRADGWRTAPGGAVYSINPDNTRNDHVHWPVAYSPRLNSQTALSCQARGGCCEGFEDWYLFQGEPPVAEFEEFVNWGGFRLDDPGYSWAIGRLWSQLDRLGAESYLADGTVLTFATRNARLFDEAVAGTGG